MIYLEPKSNDPRYNTAFELYAFNEIANQDDVFILWINEPCIVVGKNQNTVEEINQKYCDSKGIKIVRRISGGGAVYHDLNNLNYTIISNNAKDKTYDFKSMSQPVIESLGQMGIKAEFTGRNDILIDDRKICGNAQYVRGDRVMHHGCILFDVDLHVLGQALQVSADKIESKGKKSVRTRVTNIKDHLADKSITVIDFKNILRAYMDKHYHMTEHVLSDAQNQEVLKLQASHNDSWDWVYGKNPEFSIKRERRLLTGKVEAYILVKDNMIENVKFYGDFFGVKDVEDIAKTLQGIKYTHEDVKAGLSQLDIGSYFMGISLGDIVDIIID